MTRDFIPYGRQNINNNDIERVVEILKSDFLTTGPMVELFEKKIAEYVGAKYAVVVSNGTAALHAACFAADIGPGDEVITSPITFAASANCVLYQGGTPVFADINTKTYNIDPKSIEEKITDKTKAIIPVHYTGQSVDLDPIIKIAKKYDLKIIGDAAHAIGTKYKGKKIGSIVDMTEFSFHPVKTITSGEGGAITTNSKELYEKLKLFRTHGITKENDQLINNEGPWYYEQQDLGYNYRLTDIQCALGISQLERIEAFKKRRNEITEEYNKAFKDLDEIILQEEPDFSDTSRHLYIIQLVLEKLTIGRKEFFNKLRDKNIGVNVHYVPVYFHPYYKNMGYEKGLCPHAEKLYERMITIPLHPSMSDEDVNYVINTIKTLVNKYRK
jgi:UDP-4-amino-4,6-dideoxy-N-acetyl-beta-L-altrosamine transaminase